jgi:hypothetical protein
LNLIDYPQKKEVPVKRKKEAKKEKRVEIWKTQGSFPHPNTTNKQQVNYYLSLEL